MEQPQVFIGSASESSYLVDGMSAEIQKINCESVPWNKITYETSKHFLDTFDKNLEKCDFGIFFLTPDDTVESRGKTAFTTRDNVLFEAGMFMGKLGRDRVFLIIDGSKWREYKMPSDLMGITVLTYNSTHIDPQNPDPGKVSIALTNAVSTIKNKIRNLKCIKKDNPNPHRIDNVLDRGSTTQVGTLIDGAIYTGEERSKYFNELKKRLRLGETVPMKYLYWTPQGSESWLDLCNSPLYRFNRNSIHLIQTHSYAITQNIINACGSPEIDFVSIGSGDGNKDNLLMRSLCKELNENQKIYYYPVDISDTLLEKAIPRAIDSGGVDRNKFYARAILADFNMLYELKPIYEYRNNYNVFSVLGNTIGNSDEVTLLRSLDRAMLNGDILLVEINTTKTDESDTSINDITSMRLDFAPLSMMGYSFEQDKFRYTTEQNISTVPKTQTITSYYGPITIDGQNIEEVKLSVIHQYDPLEFENHICQNLNLVKIAAYQSQNVTLFVFKRPKNGE